jgi:dTDP-4-amino-4,6-dideoxygalactose transaminase
LNIAPDKIEEKITARTKAIVVTHVYGHPVDMVPVLQVARRHKLAVIEDASHAHGGEYQGCKIGTLGDIACFSLQDNKLLSGGEAGLLVTNRREYFEKAVMLGHYERMPKLRSRRARKYLGSETIPPMNFCFKYRIHPFAAAMALVQLKYLDRRNALQRKQVEYLGRGLAKIAGFDPPFVAGYATQVNWLNYLARFYPDQFPGISRERVIEALLAEGVAAGRGRAGYIPLHLQPLLREQDMFGKGCPWKCRHARPQRVYRAGDFPVAERVYRERILLPTFRDLVFDSDRLDQYLAAFKKISDNRAELR